MSYQPVWNKVLQCVSCLDPCLKISRGNPAKMNSCIWRAKLLNTWTSWKFSCHNSIEEWPVTLDTVPRNIDVLSPCCSSSNGLKQLREPNEIKKVLSPQLLGDVGDQESWDRGTGPSLWACGRFGWTGPPIFRGPKLQINNPLSLLIFGPNILSAVCCFKFSHACVLQLADPFLIGC